MAIKVYGFDGNSRTNAVKAVANYSGVDIDYVKVDPFNKASLPKEFSAKFPLQLVPTLEDGETLVSETPAVAYYIASKASDRANLFGKTDAERVEIMQWSTFANTSLLGAIGSWFQPIVKGPYNKKSVDDGKAATAKLFGILDKHLESRTFLAGERVSFADLVAGAVIQRGAEYVVDQAFFAQFPNVLRYFNTVQRQPEVIKVRGSEPSVVDKAVEYTPPKKEKAPAAAPAAAAPKAEKAPKKKEVEEDDDEPAVPAEPKAKHPCESLGKAALVLDDWKRKYSNEDTPVAMKWLEENLKPDEYSFWKVTYKYPEELTQVFMSSNLIGGFHNRLEGSRKYLFGSACVYGTSNNSKIQGVYMLRGADWKPVFEVGPDYESYEFEPLDFAKDREIIGKNWAWEDEMDGLKVADGKVFK